MGNMLAQCIDAVIAKYPAGWIEVFANISIQLSYLAFGIVVEWTRPYYSSKTTTKMIMQSLQNHSVGAILHILYVVYTRGDPVLTRTYLRPYALPSWTEVVSDMVAAMLLRDALCYAIHRLWHAPGVYKRVHAKHHEILDPAEHHVWTVSYMSVVDFVFLYGAPVVAISKVLEMNLMTVAVFAFFSAVGEQVKLVYGDESHDEHHVAGSVNYGVYGIMDALLGTSGSGKKTGKVE